MKVIPFLVTGFLLALAGFVLYFVLNGQLDGFTSKQAQPGIILFIGFWVVFALIAAILSGIAANYFIEKKEKSLAIASLISIPVFFVVGLIAMIIGLAISVAVADAFRY